MKVVAGTLWLVFEGTGTLRPTPLDRRPALEKRTSGHRMASSSNCQTPWDRADVQTLRRLAPVTSRGCSASAVSVK